jgi:addiction module HigA family antidote
MTKKILPPIHPGAILMEEFITPIGVSQSEVARSMNVPPRRVNEIVLGKRSITADTAVRLGLCFNTTPQFWINLQATYDLAVVLDRFGERLNNEVTSLAG